ncbi:MAG TPA: chloride channel protein, partial [candidate division Zixibacteria bacterium]|nr:chloride channel protein [candidate division Zixibacteria bacterium]
MKPLRVTSRILKRFLESPTEILIVLSVFVGLVTALGALAFRALIDFANHLFFGLTDQVLTKSLGAGSFKWWLPIVPALGGLIVGAIVLRFAAEARGHGVPEVMNAVARLGGIIRPRVAAVKTIASAICLGSGGSAGREGPIVQIGSALGSTIGQLFRMSGDRIKILVGCGAAAGISSVFNAPIAGVIFTLEVVLGDFALATFSPVIISSVVASVVTRSVLGANPAFAVPTFALVSGWEMPLYALLGVLLGGVGFVFTRMMVACEEFFEKMAIANWLKPALGGLLLGGIAVFFPQVLADGYGTIRLTLQGEMALWLMAALVFLKILATSLTLGSGNSGGIFAPSLFIGAGAGGAFGAVAERLFPAATAPPGAYALVGMAGMVAAATHAPITALLIIFEMTSDFRVILPLMVVVVFAALVARRLYPHSIFTAKLIRSGIDIRGGRDVNVLRSHRVAEVMSREFETVDISASLHDILVKIEESRESYFLVMDRREVLRGVISFQDIRAVLSQRTLDRLVIARDIVHEEVVTLGTDDTLERAFQLFSARGLRLIPVVDGGPGERVVGVLRR